jgi:sacsin
LALTLRNFAFPKQNFCQYQVTFACANLIADLVEDIGKDNRDEFYKLWPVNKITVSKALEELHRYVTQLLYQKNVVRSTVNHTWVTPPTVKVLSGDWWKKLVSPLCADNIYIPDPPLPTAILSAFKEANCHIETFKPADLRKHLTENKPLGVPLQDAPKASLRNRQWIVDILQYCISDGHRDLRGLPLAILANDTLQVFGYNPIGTIYIADEKARQIFANYPEWFIHANLYNQVSLFNRVGVSNMDVTEVAKKLVNVIGSQSKVYEWEPDAPNPPNAKWLTLVYRYFANVNQRYLPLEELKAAPLVPGDDGKLHKGGFFNTPLLRLSEINDETVAAVKYFGVPLIKAPPNLEEAIDNFIKQHPGKLIWLITGSTVTKYIYLRYEQYLPLYDRKYYTSILNFLSDKRWLTGEREYRSDKYTQLRQLPIYPTNSDELVSLNDENIYIPGDGYEPPEIAGTLRLLRLGTAKKEWLPLFRLLEVPVLNRARLIKDCLLPEYLSLASDEQLTVLAWIRDNLREAKKELQGEPQTLATLKEEIKKARLVRCTDGRLRSPALIYTPESEIVSRILGNKAAIPDMEFYLQDSPLWLDFFESLGMQAKPSADDLLACVDNLIQKANISGSDAVADACIEVFNYIVDNWEDIKEAKVNNGTKELIEAIRDKPWLPVERQPEKLQEYAGVITPENRLYRAKDVCFIQDAHLVASQKPIFARSQRNLLKVEIRNALGFQPIEPNRVLDHFDTLIGLWENDR